MTSVSATTVAWNILSYLLYAALVVVGGFEVWLSFFFGMATDACHDPACDAGFHVWPAMVIIWIGVAAVLGAMPDSDLDRAGWLTHAVMDLHANPEKRPPYKEILKIMFDRFIGAERLGNTVGAR